MDRPGLFTVALPFLRNWVFCEMHNLQQTEESWERQRGSCMKGSVLAPLFLVRDTVGAMRPCETTRVQTISSEQAWVLALGIAQKQRGWSGSSCNRRFCWCFLHSDRSSGTSQILGFDSGVPLNKRDISSSPGLLEMWSSETGTFTITSCFPQTTIQHLA